MSDENMQDAESRLFEEVSEFQLVHLCHLPKALLRAYQGEISEYVIGLVTGQVIQFECLLPDKLKLFEGWIRLEGITRHNVALEGKEGRFSFRSMDLRVDQIVWAFE